MWITQPQAAELSKNMYTSSCFTSDLINSYAWDTAILFLQECGKNLLYSRQESINKSRYDKGSNNENNQDVQCNIFDMASNAIEWTTETCNYITPLGVNYSVGCRGGFYNTGKLYSSMREKQPIVSSWGNFGFRPILYI